MKYSHAQEDQKYFSFLKPKIQVEYALRRFDLVELMEYYVIPAQPSLTTVIYIRCIHTLESG